MHAIAADQAVALGIVGHKVVTCLFASGAAIEKKGYAEDQGNAQQKAPEYRYTVAFCCLYIVQIFG